MGGHTLLCGALSAGDPGLTCVVELGLGVPLDQRLLWCSLEEGVMGNVRCMAGRSIVGLDTCETLGGYEQE